MQVLRSCSKVERYCSFQSHMQFQLFRLNQSDGVQCPAVAAPLRSSRHTHQRGHTPTPTHTHTHTHTYTHTQGHKGRRASGAPRHLYETRGREIAAQATAWPARRAGGAMPNKRRPICFPDPHCQACANRERSCAPRCLSEPQRSEATTGSWNIGVLCARVQEHCAAGPLKKGEKNRNGRIRLGDTQNLLQLPHSKGTVEKSFSTFFHFLRICCAVGSQRR